MPAAPRLVEDKIGQCYERQLDAERPAVGVRLDARRFGRIADAKS